MASRKAPLIFSPFRSGQTFEKRHKDVLLALLLSSAVALAVSVPSLKLSVALVAGLLALLMIMIRPALGVYALAFAVPFGSEVEVSVGPLSASVTEGMVGLVLTGWLARLTVYPDTKVFLSPLFWPLLLLFSVVALSVPQAPSIPLAAKESFKWLEVLAVFLVTANLLDSGGRRLALVVAMLLAGVMEAAIGLAQSATGAGPLGFLLEGGLLRAYGTFGQPNPYAGYLVATLALALGITSGALRLSSPRKRSPTSRTGQALGLGRWKPWLLGAAFTTPSVVIMLAGTAASASRGALLALVAAVAVSALRNRAVMAAVTAAVVLVFSIAALGPAIPVPEFITSRLEVSLEYFRLFDARTVIPTPESWSIVQRMALWQSAWGMFQQRPLTGIGAGNFDLVYPHFALPGWEAFPPGHAHNVYLNFLAETGVIGLLGYAVLIVSILIYCLRTLLSGRPSQPPEAENNFLALWSGPAPLAMGVLASVTAISAHNVFDNLYVHGIPVFLGLLLGLVASANLWMGPDNAQTIAETK